MVYLMPNSSVEKNCSGSIQSKPVKIRYTYTKCISHWDENVIEPLEFELAYNDIKIQHVSRYATRDLRNRLTWVLNMMNIK